MFEMLDVNDVGEKFGEFECGANEHLEDKLTCLVTKWSYSSTFCRDPVPQWDILRQDIKGVKIGGMAESTSEYLGRKHHDSWLFAPAHRALQKDPGL